VPTAFWDGLAGRVAEQFSARVLTPAFVFWTGGLAAWSWHQAHRRPSAGWTAPLLQAASSFQRLTVVLQVALLVAVLLVLSGSAVIGERLTLPLLRLLEGYGWPPPLARVLRARIADRRTRHYTRWGELLARRDADGLSAAEAAELDRLDAQLHRVPAALELTMPTRLGIPCGWPRPSRG